MRSFVPFGLQSLPRAKRRDEPSGRNIAKNSPRVHLLKRTYHHKGKYLRGFTKRYNLNKLVYYEGFGNITSARVRERKIKGWKREKKIKLIESMNPKWEDLYRGLKGDPSALQPALSKAKGPQDDPSIHEKTPRGVNYLPTTTTKIVTNLNQALQVREIRNPCCEFMTNNSRPIGIPGQIYWYFWHYRADRQAGHYRLYLFYDHCGTPIGYGALRLKGKQLYDTVCVGRAYWGQGYGTAILRELIKIAQAEKRDLVAEIWSSNETSIIMHKKAGFEFIENGMRNGKSLHVFILRQA